MPAPAISVVITTRNRRDELNRALKSCFSQVGVSFEVLVYDDASDDGTDSIVREEFPQCRLIRSDDRAGLIVRRNQSFHDAQGEFVLSLDDDAYFTHPETLSQVCLLFAQEPKTAAWGLKYFEPAKDAKMPALASGTLIKSYIGCAHALRRQVAEELGGYPAFLVHQGEERDLCIRFMEHGWDIRFAETPPIVHLCSIYRENWRMFYYGYRNLVLFNWMRTPLRLFFPRLTIDIGQLIAYRFQLKTIPSKIWCIGAGFLSILRYWNERQPVSTETYRKFRQLPGHGPSTQPEGVTPAPCIESQRQETAAST
jgi:GT2 family glycosyltransferase